MVVRTPEPVTVVGFVVRPLPILDDEGRNAAERHATDYDTSVATACLTKSQAWRPPSMQVPKIG